MIDIAGSVVALLAPYLVKAGESAAQEMGKTGFGKVKAIYQAIAQKFSRDDHGQQALKRLEEKPLDEKRQRDLIDLLAKNVTEDPEFAKKLAVLVENVTEGNPTNQVVTQIFGSVEKYVTIGDVHGNVSI
jgi:predicted lipid-binding transport protein (Tim44 family)